MRRRYAPVFEAVATVLTALAFVMMASGVSAVVFYLLHPEFRG